LSPLEFVAVLTTPLKAEGTRYRWFSGKLDKVMVVRQMVESVSGWYIFELEKGVEWCSQGSVLGSVLFLIFINDLDNAISNNLLKFTDDTKVRAVDNRFDGVRLQSDFDSLGDWGVKWQMKFNVEKIKLYITVKEVLILNTVYMGSLLRK